MIGFRQILIPYAAVLLNSVVFLFYGCAPVDRPQQTRLPGEMSAEHQRELSKSNVNIIAPQEVPNLIGERVLQTEAPAVNASFEQLAKGGYQVLSCRYFGALGTNEQTAFAYYWYKQVGLQQKELVFQSIGHPLIVLGDLPRTECPLTRDDALKINSTTMQLYEKNKLDFFLYLTKLPDDPGAPKVLYANSCATLSGNNEFTNNCSFPVNFLWCGIAFKSACIPSWRGELAPHREHYFPGVPTKLHAVACPAPYWPVLPPRGYLFNDHPWRCKLDKQQ